MMIDSKGPVCPGLRIFRVRTRCGEIAGRTINLRENAHRLGRDEIAALVPMADGILQLKYGLLIAEKRYDRG